MLSHLYTLQQELFNKESEYHDNDKLRLANLNKIAAKFSAIPADTNEVFDGLSGAISSVSSSLQYARKVMKSLTNFSGEFASVYGESEDRANTKIFGSTNKAGLTAGQFSTLYMDLLEKKFNWYGTVIPEYLLVEVNGGQSYWTDDPKHTPHFLDLLYDSLIKSKHIGFLGNLTPNDKDSSDGKNEESDFDKTIKEYYVRSPRARVGSEWENIKSFEHYKHHKDKIDERDSLEAKLTSFDDVITESGIAASAIFPKSSGNQNFYKIYNTRERVAVPLYRIESLKKKIEDLNSVDRDGKYKQNLDTVYFQQNLYNSSCVPPLNFYREIGYIGRSKNFSLDDKGIEIYTKPKKNQFRNSESFSFLNLNENPLSSISNTYRRESSTLSMRDNLDLTDLKSGNFSEVNQQVMTSDSLITNDLASALAKVLISELGNMSVQEGDGGDYGGDSQSRESLLTRGTRGDPVYVKMTSDQMSYQRRFPARSVGSLPSESLPSPGMVVL